MTAVTGDQAETVTANIPGEKSAGEKSSVGEKGVGEKSAPTVGEKSLVKNPSPLAAKTTDFSPTRRKDFSPTPDRDFSPTRERDFSPTKKPDLKLVKPAKSGKRGRPRNPELPPAPGQYFYWGKARNGLKLERRKPEYEYIGFIMPQEWLPLRGKFDEEYILKIITTAIRIKRARTAQTARTGASSAG